LVRAGSLENSLRAISQHGRDRPHSQKQLPAMEEFLVSGRGGACNTKASQGFQQGARFGVVDVGKPADSPADQRLDHWLNPPDEIAVLTILL
jgi:hypothetical protein